MKCTGRIYRLMAVLFLSVILVSGCREAEEVTVVYETENYNRDIYRGELSAGNLCVALDNIVPDGILDLSTLHASALFDVNNSKVDFAYNIHERLFPASTTKIMTALLAIKHADLNAVTTVSVNASSTSFAADESICGIVTGDQLTIRDLLYGLMLRSGNDAAVAIAEHVAGSVEGFAQMMNEEAQSLMATNTHFVNPNGLHDADHYTTAYDLYLIFNECIRHQEFIDIIATPQYTVNITGADGAVRQADWMQTNYYASGRAEQPVGASVVGGKTGTTNEAGNCLILLEKGANDENYISIVMGAVSKNLLYQNMTAMINSIPVYQ